jgi:subtilisin family serine protease
MPSLRGTSVVLSLAVALCAAGCEDQVTPAADAGPLTPYGERPFPAPVAADFALDPAVGFPLSTRHLIVAFAESASEPEAARVVASTGGALVGALGAAHIAMVRLPEGTTPAARLALVERLGRDPAVAAVTEDMLVGTTQAPARNENFPQWDWDAPASSAGNHALRAMGMPIAWNLNPVVQPVAAARRVRVGVIDGTVQRHPDLVPDVMTILGDATPDTGRHHGTAVAGIIGARWDARGTDGVSPFVAITATVVAGGDLGAWDSLVPTPQAVIATYGQSISQSWQVIRGARPRVVNLSLAFNHNSTCYRFPVVGRAYRCDPRQGSTQWGVAVSDSRCDGALVRQRIAQSGLVFDALVRAAQATAPTLFVVAAGNDSGPSGGDDVCAVADINTVRIGLGLFPAELASPYANAAIARGNTHIVVVEAVRPNEDMRGALQRAYYSNVGGDVLAPGDRVQAPAGGASNAGYASFDGTSSASPHVAGAAAYLLALAPQLGNPELRALLLAQQGAPVADTPTRARLYLPAALARLRVALPTAGAAADATRLLADMDDGTAHGLSVNTFDAFGRPTGRSTSRHDVMRAPAVDMADFRYLRNSALLYRGASTVDCPNGVPACDLNGDTRWSFGPQAERHPRAEIVQVAAGETNLAAGPNLAAFAEQFEGDPVQGWRRDELAGLAQSCDLEFFVADFLSRTGASAVRVTITGSPSGPDAPARREPVTDLSLGAGPVVLTVPFRDRLGVRVTAVGGRYDGRSFETERSLEAAPGGHLALFVNACAGDEMRPRDILDPYTPDCAEPDAGVPDAGVPDAGVPDAGVPDAGVPDAGVPDAGASDDCARLAVGTAPYVCFSLTGSSLPRTYGASYGVVPPSTFRAYYNSATGRTLFRMSGRPMVNGEFELVDVTFNTPGNGASSERWPTDVAPSTIHITFSDGDILGGPGTLRDFDPSATAGGSGLTTISTYGPVDGMITGTFSGVGLVTQVHPSSARFEPATLTGSFRVPRTPDT